MTSLPILAALLWSASGDVVARVDGRVITAGELTHRIEATTSMGMRPRAEQVLATMIDETVLTAEGRRLALERSAVATTRFETLQRIQAGALFLEREIAGRATPDESTIRELFHSTADFAAFDLLTFDSAEKASAALARLRGGRTFAAEAAGAITSRVQASPAAAPLVMRGELPPALADALLGAAEGALVGPVALPEGFGVARLLKKVVGTEAELAARRAAIVTHARDQLAERMQRHVVDQLRERARVKLDEPFLRSVDDLEPTEAQLDHTLATVDGRALRYRDIFDDVRAIRANGGHMGPSLRIAVAWQAVDARLVQAVAVERGLLSDPAIVALRAEHLGAAVGYAASVRLMDGAPRPTRAEVEAFYERNARAFQRPLREVLPQATAGAAREKRFAAYAEGVTALRRKAAISIDRDVLARMTSPGA